LLALTGCGQPPSFELSWQISETLEDPPPLTAVKQCSDVGVFSVRVTVRAGNEKVAIDEHPCASSIDSSVEGPPLEPGEYTIEVQGLRRSGEPWFDPEVDAEADPIAYSKQTLIVSDGALPSVNVVLLAPPECDDGIDNDRDGTVDGQDPGCQIVTETGFSESNDTGLTLFQLDVAFLDRSVVKPDNVGVTGIRLEIAAWQPPDTITIDGQRPNQFERTIANYELDYSQWPFPVPLLSAELDGSGTLELLATAVGPDGDMTETQSIPFPIVEGEGTYVFGHLAFGIDRFLQPIVEPIALVFEPGCSPGGTLALERMWIRVVDESDAPLDAATLGLTGTTISGGSAMAILPVDEAGGWVSFECPSSVVRTNELVWGNYQIEARAVRAADTCFESPIADLAPQPFSAQTIGLERVLIDDLPACPECVDNADCSGQICNEGLCVDQEPG
jgi:hypothetical protein